MSVGSNATPVEVGGDVFCEFLEVALHTVLYMRKVYPPGVFEKRKKYNIPVQLCQHPDVSRYVEQVVDGVRCLMDDNMLEKVVIVVLTTDGKPVERFVIEISAPSRNAPQSDGFLFRLEDALRGFLLKLNMCDSMLRPAPTHDLTWSVHVHTRESAAARLEERAQYQKFPWVQVDEDQISLRQPNLVPLKASASEVLKMQLYVEEADYKDAG